jgi:hypothetical protein
MAASQETESPMRLRRGTPRNDKHDERLLSRLREITQTTPLADRDPDDVELRLRTMTYGRGGGRHSSVVEPV